jgi:arginine-tRNA-protein transferase
LRAWLDALPLSEPAPCGYFQDKNAREQRFVWPKSQGMMPGALYQTLMDQNFRRSGRLFYRPRCDGCALCVPIRLRTEEFVHSRSQARTWKKNADLEVRWQTPKIDAARIDLYARYVAERHDKDASEDLPSELEFFLYDSPTQTLEASYWLDGQLVACGICDLTPLALSTVYFFYDPAAARRSLGLFSALVEIDYATKRALPYYYLGYWVSGCRKMEYKAGLSAHELLTAGEWQHTQRKNPGNS